MNDPAVCNNQTFWAQQPCLYDGEYHCNGTNNGQCGSKSWPCFDKSDQVFHMGQSCNVTYDWGGEDVLHCTDSCSSVDCDEGACSNPAYPRCSKDKTCYNPSLRCDMHPTCSDGEDEKDCVEEYVKKNYFPAAVSFPCQSPHYPDLVEILSIRCDSVSECYQDKDEKGCKEPLVQSEIIGDKHG